LRCGIEVGGGDALQSGNLVSQTTPSPTPIVAVRPSCSAIIRPESTKLKTIASVPSRLMVAALRDTRCAVAFIFETLMASTVAPLNMASKGVRSTRL
jgi:hypothetical protein